MRSVYGRQPTSVALQLHVGDLLEKLDGEPETMVGEMNRSA